MELWLTHLAACLVGAGLMYLYAAYSAKPIRRPFGSRKLHSNGPNDRFYGTSNPPPSDVPTPHGIRREPGDPGAPG